MVVGRNAVPPAEIELVDRLGVVVERAVITARVERFALQRRFRQRLRDFGDRAAGIGQPHRLVVDVAVDVALVAQKLLDILRAPFRPVMGGEDDIGRAVFGQHMVDHLAPFQQVADMGAARRQRIVQGARRNLGGAERIELRQVEHEFARGFGVGRVDEFEDDAVDRALRAGPRNFLGRRNQADGTLGKGRSETDRDLGGRIMRQRIAEHQHGPPGHVVAGQQVFGNGRRQEAFGRKDRDVAGLRVVLVDHAAHPTEMIGMAVRVDHAGDRPFAQRVVDQFQRRRRRLARQQRIDHDPSRLAADHGHHCQIVAAHLPDTVRDLEQSVQIGQLRLPPERRIDRVGAFAGNEIRRLDRPDDIAVGIMDRVGVDLRQQPALRILEIGL